MPQPPHVYFPLTPDDRQVVSRWLPAGGSSAIADVAQVVGHALFPQLLAVLYLDIVGNARDSEAGRAWESRVAARTLPVLDDDGASRVMDEFHARLLERVAPLCSLEVCGIVRDVASLYRSGATKEAVLGVLHSVARIVRGVDYYAYYAAAASPSWSTSYAEKAGVPLADQREILFGVLFGVLP